MLYPTKIVPKVASIKPAIISFLPRLMIEINNIIADAGQKNIKLNSDALNTLQPSPVQIAESFGVIMVMKIMSNISL